MNGTTWYYVTTHTQKLYMFKFVKHIMLYIDSYSYCSKRYSVPPTGLLPSFATILVSSSVAVPPPCSCFSGLLT